MNSTAIVTSSKAEKVGLAAIRQEQLPRRISINPQDERITTVIAEKTAMNGNFNFAEGVKIDGRLTGSVMFGIEDGMCIVSKTGLVDGDIHGPRALVLGTVNGDINIDGILVLAQSAVITGNVTYGRLVVYDGAVITGTLQRQKHDQQNESEPCHEKMHQGHADVLPLQRQQA